MKKFFFNVIFFMLLILSLFFFLDGNNELKYEIFKTFLGVFQNKTEKSLYYEFEVPNEWVLLKRNQDYLSFLGPVWNQNDEMSSVKVFTNYDHFINYAHYFDPSICTNLDNIVDVNNSITVINSSDVKSVLSPAKIIFCNEGKKHKAYIAYSNPGSMTYILINNYEENYKKNYLRVLSKIQYTINMDDIPKWITEEP